MKKRILKATTEKRGKKLIAIASTPNADRMGDSLPLDKWDLKNFKNNPVLQAGHDYKPQFTIGIAKNIKVENNQLTFEPVFHGITALARETKTMYDEGFLKAWSVGFIPGDQKYDKESGEFITIGKNELLEVSAVAVPANAEALTELKSFDNETEKSNPSISIKSWIKKELKKELEKDIEKEDEKEDEKEEEEVEDEELEEEEKEEKEEIKESVIKEDKKEEKEKEEEEEKEEEKDEDEKIEDEKVEEKKQNKSNVKEKAGKIISEKNKKIIQNRITNLKDTVSTLEKLLDISEKPKEAPKKKINQEKSEDENIKGRKAMKKKQLIDIDELTLQLLKKVAANANRALQHINSKN